MSLLRDHLDCPGPLSRLPRHVGDEGWSERLDRTSRVIDTKLPNDLQRKLGILDAYAWDSAIE